LIALPAVERYARGMVRLALVLVAAVYVVPAMAAPRARGKVVRVERTRSATIAPRICDVRGDRGGTCLGTQPQLGDVVNLLDETGVVAQARIADVTPVSASSRTTTCESMWTIRTDVVRGDLSGLTPRTLGVVDPDLHLQRAHLVPRDQLPPSPTGRDDDTVLAAIDRDGDRTADLVLTQTTCEASLGGGLCLEQWARIDGRFKRVQQTNFASCGM
jgi:hypothetical protein